MLRFVNQRSLKHITSVYRPQKFTFPLSFQVRCESRKVTALKLEKGDVIKHKGQLKTITNIQHQAQAMRRGLILVESVNLQTGVKYNDRFRSTEKLDVVESEVISMKFKEHKNKFLIFEDEFGDEVQVPETCLPEDPRFLQEGMEVPITFAEDKPVFVKLPILMTLKVEETPPPSRDPNLKTQPTKHAVLENGIRVRGVPFFVENGDEIVVRVSDCTYVSRVLSKETSDISHEEEYEQDENYEEEYEEENEEENEEEYEEDNEEEIEPKEEKPESEKKEKKKTKKVKKEKKEKKEKKKLKKKKSK